MDTATAVNQDQDQDQDLQLIAIRELQQLIPYNELGLPKGIYRPDLLPLHDYKTQAQRTEEEYLRNQRLLEEHKKTLEEAAETKAKAAEEAEAAVLAAQQAALTAAHINATPLSEVPLVGFDGDGEADAQGTKVNDDTDTDTVTDNDGVPNVTTDTIVEALEGDLFDNMEQYRIREDAALATQESALAAAQGAVDAAQEAAEIAREMKEVSERQIEDAEQGISFLTRRTAGFLTADLDQAFEWLYYDEGFPTQKNGEPFWERLAWESPPAYRMFERYLQLGTQDNKEEPRSVSHLVRSLLKETGRGDTEADKVNDDTDTEVLAMLDEVNRCAVLNYWAPRARAYDMFRIADYKRQMALRAIELNEDHFLYAQQQMHKLREFIDDEEMFWEELTPKTALEYLRLLQQTQRVSIGLPATAPPPEKHESTQGQSQSLELHYRRVAKSFSAPVDSGDARDDRSGDAIFVGSSDMSRQGRSKRDDRRGEATGRGPGRPSRGGGGGRGRARAEEEEATIIDMGGTVTRDLDRALEDPRFTADLQELVIKMFKGKT